jgi:phage anti-repressor protein
MLTMSQPTTGTKVYCYIDDYGFTENEEYVICREDENGYYIKDNDGIEVLFETITDIKSTFMIE